MEYEPILKPKEVALRLGLAESTIRRWAILLEKAGYVFLTEKRGEIKARMFVERDVQVFACLKALSNDRSLSRDKAVEMTMDRMKSLFDKQKTHTDSKQTDIDSNHADMDSNHADFDSNQTDIDLPQTPSVIEKSFADFEEYIGDIIERRISERMEQDAKRNREFIQALEMRLEAQQEFIETFLKSRDLAFTEAMNGLLEAATSKQETKPWWKFWVGRI